MPSVLTARIWGGRYLANRREPWGQRTSANIYGSAPSCPSQGQQGAKVILEVSSGRVAAGLWPTHTPLSHYAECSAVAHSGSTSSRYHVLRTWIWLGTPAPLACIELALTPDAANWSPMQ